MTTYTRTDLEKMFDEHLDSTIDPFGWEPHFWNASRVLKAVALPIYTEMFWNWFHGEEFVELPAPQDSPDVELYARQTDLEDEQPLSFEEWCHAVDIESKYQSFYNEYGDSACSLSEYKEMHYEFYIHGFALHS